MPAGPSIDAPVGPLLATKLYLPPVRAEWVSRPRLVERLQQGLDRKLTLVSAPAGFGKSTVLSQCAMLCGRPVAWLSLDDGDNDPTRLWTYVMTATQMVQPGTGATAIAALQSRQSAQTELLLTGWINEIAASSKPFLLILDDLHLITEPAVHDQLTFLIENMPPQMHLIVSTRADPPWPLALFRGRGQMTELRANDLRFTPEEASTFLNDMMGLNLCSEDVDALEARTEGWIVGLQMAALSMRGREDASTFIRAFAGTHRFVLDYLVEEVLSQQSSAVQDFLLRTSILDRLSGSLCDAVADCSDSRTLLAQLERANLFLVPLDDERRWYRYHHLFADLLRQRLEQSLPDEVAGLHGRASEWYERNGLIAEAMNHALAAGNVERVARLAGGNALAMMEHSQLRPLERWLDGLPDEVVESQPWLCVAHAWMLAFTGKPRAVEPLLQDAEKIAAEWEESSEGRIRSADERQHMAGHIAAIRAYVAGVTGDAREAVEYARQARRHLPADDLVTRAWAAAALALNLYRCGDLAAGDEALEEAVELGRAIGASYVAVMVLCNLAAVRMQHGRLVEAEDIFREALQLAEEHAQRSGRPLSVSGYAHTYLARVLCEWNELEAAVTHARVGIELCELWGEPQLLTGSYICLASLFQTIGDAGGALDALDKAKQAASSLSPWYAARVAPLEALIRLRQGDIAEACQWAASQEDAPENYFDVFEYWHARLMVARVRMAQGEWDQVLEVLTPLLRATEEAGGLHHVVVSLALQAIALQAQGDAEQALTALERALSIAEPEGYVRTFIDEGAPMARLLRQAIERGITVEYASRLLAAMERETKDDGQLAPVRPSSVGDRSSSVLVEPLSGREMEVLRLLATRLSSAEMADHLVISVHTVRSHIKSIYAKLDVHKRHEAVARARELGLL
jgi:LuxR family maltose regulon positive regulatory protein